MREKQLAFKQFELDTNRAFRSHQESPHHNTLHNMLSSPSNHDQDLSPKAKVSYDESKFQVELNVHGYSPEELSIKTEGDVLIILARHETKTETGTNFVSKQFEQRFSLPSGVKPDYITSSLSKDGVLVVTAPREQSQHHVLLHNNNLTSPGSTSTFITPKTENIDVFNSSPRSLAPGTGGGGGGGGGEGLPQPKVKYEDDKVTISLDCRKYKPEELDVKVDGNNIVITAKQEIKEAGGTRTRVFEQKFSLPSGVKPETIHSNLSKDGTLIISAPRGNTSASISRQTVEQHMDRVLSPSSWNRRDSFPLENNDDNIKILTENDTYKILVNVSSYKPEELVIKTLGNSVHIEAKHEEKTSDGRSFSSRNFSQSFTLPKGVNAESVTSSLSKDGILTVSAPLPGNKLQDSERFVPIKHS